jgi:hypothetical protein
MAALRERHPARDGVGHADRPRLHNTLSLDTESGSVRLSLAGRRRHSHSYSNINTYRDTNHNSHCDGNFYADTATYPDTEGCTDAEAASYAATAAIARNLQQLVMRCSGDEPLPADRRSAYAVWFADYKLLFAQQRWRGMSLSRFLQPNAKNY